MTPAEQAVYDAYPQLTAQLLAAVTALGRLPLPQMRAVANRLALTGTFNGASHGRQVDPKAALRQGGLIDAVMRFLDEARRIGEEGQAT